MDRKVFDQQIARLRSQWPHSYGLERTARIWQCFSKMHEVMFVAIIDLALDGERNAPLASDLAKLETKVLERKAKERTYGSKDLHLSTGELLKTAAVRTRANKEFVDRCLSLIREKLQGKINKENFFQGCEILQQAASIYAMPSLPEPELPRVDLKKDWAY